MVSEPAVAENVVRQVNTIPQWLLPLWANWPLVFLGVIMIIIMLVGLFRMSARLTVVLRLDQKLDSLGNQMGSHRATTVQELLTLRSDVQQLSERVVLLEERSP